MKRSITLQSDLSQVSTIQNLTTVFESIASLRISQIKDRALSGKVFFNELWKLYSQLRADPDSPPTLTAGGSIKRRALVLVTSDSGLTGDIDERIVGLLVPQLKGQSADIIAIGIHGQNLLKERGIKAAHSFELPEVGHTGTISQIIDLIKQYQQTTVFYQTYLSLTRQQVAQIDLITAVAKLGRSQAKSGQLITTQDYIFEPSADQIIEYLERVMLEIALGQILLESLLAQQASRFNAMRTASQTAADLRDKLTLDLAGSRRSERDDRIKETFNALKSGFDRG